MSDDTLVQGSSRVVSIASGMQIHQGEDERGVPVPMSRWNRLKRRIRKSDEPLNLWGAVASFASGAFLTAFPEMRAEYTRGDTGFYTIIAVAAAVGTVLAG